MFDLPFPIAFLAAVSILTMTPGVDTALVLREAMVDGRRPAMIAAVGISLGCLIWGAAVSLGLGALLRASEKAYTIVNFAGPAEQILMQTISSEDTGPADGRHLRCIRGQARHNAPLKGFQTSPEVTGFFASEAGRQTQR